MSGEFLTLNRTVASFININGKLLPANEGAIRADSRAFRYGYGLFETMMVREGVIRLFALHMARLKEGMTALQISCSPHFFKELEDALQRTISRNAQEALGRVRLQVWPSSGGYYDGDAFAAQYCIETFPLSEEILSFNENGLIIGIADGIIKTADNYSHIKACNALPYALAARQAKDKYWNDALLPNQHGNIADSTIANLFWVKNGQIFTPPLSEGCVAGVMRQHLLRQIPLLGYTVSEQTADFQTIADADAIFLSNAIREYGG